jgi:hypothetical protein
MMKRTTCPAPQPAARVPTQTARQPPMPVEQRLLDLVEAGKAS